MKPQELKAAVEQSLADHGVAYLWFVREAHGAVEAVELLPTAQTQYLGSEPGWPDGIYEVAHREMLSGSRGFTRIPANDVLTIRRNDDVVLSLARYVYGEPPKEARPDASPGRRYAGLCLLGIRSCLENGHLTDEEIAELAADLNKHLEAKRPGHQAPRGGFF